MKKGLLIFPILLASLLFSACKKNSLDEKYIETVNPVLPDLLTQVNSSVSGFITDEHGDAIANANVKGGNFTVFTDNYGYFKIDNASFAKSAGFIQVIKAGYFTGYSTFIPVEGKENFIRLRLITKTNSGTASSAIGGTVTTPDGAVVSIPADAVVLASNNTAYTGNINIAIHWIDPSGQQTTQQTMPGDLRGIDSSGYLKTLVTYGMLAVELTNDAGEKLQIATGKKASIAFPIPAALVAAAPAFIPLWYFDETKGLWEQQGTAFKNNNKYEGDVSHFSFWNCDIPMSVVNFSVQLIDMNLNPLSYTAVEISIDGVPNSARTGYTDADGQVSGMVPANSNLVMKVSTMCNALIVQNIATTNSNITLGSVKVNLQQFGATFKGIVNKCNGSPVTNGYVILAGAYNQVINIDNGTFHAAGIICAGSNAAVIAYDRESLQQSDLQNFDISSGENDFGTLSACTSSNTETITYSIDGGTDVVLSLPQHMFSGNYVLGFDNTEIKAIDLLNGSIAVFTLYFDGGATPGNHLINPGSVQTDRQYQFTTIQMVNISAYGLIGEFITGTFSGPVKDMTDNSMHTFTCTFNIRRDS